MQQTNNQIEIKIGIHPLQVLKKENTACSREGDIISGIHLTNGQE